MEKFEDYSKEDLVRMAHNQQVQIMLLEGIVKLGDLARDICERKISELTEAKILHPEEIVNLPVGSVIWEECIDTGLIEPGMVSDVLGVFFVYSDGSFFSDKERDGHKFRYWSHRPTIKQIMELEDTKDE